VRIHEAFGWQAGKSGLESHLGEAKGKTKLLKISAIAAAKGPRRQVVRRVESQHGHLPALARRRCLGRSPKRRRIDSRDG